MSESLIYSFFLCFPLATGVLLVCFHKSYKIESSWWSLILGNLLMFCFLLTLSFVVGESYYRYFYDTPDSLGFTKVSSRWYQRYNIFNVSGFRDNIDYAPMIAPGKRRVTFLGDSFTMGHGINKVDDRFGNLIRAAHPEWEINVIAFAGLETQGEIDLLEAGLKNGYQIDQVVLVYCLNDVADILPEWGVAYQTVMADANEDNWLLQNSYFMNIIHHRYEATHHAELTNYFEFVKKGYSGSLWEKQKKRLTALRDLVNSHGGRLQVVTFPFLHAVGPNYEFQLVHEKLNRFWEQQNVPHLDLLSEYSKFAPEKITVNRYDAHPNEFANAVAAKVVDGFLKTNMK